MTVTLSLDVGLECTERCFELPEWKELLARDPDSHIFATPEWNRIWWDEFGAGKELFLLIMRRAADVVAVVPMYRKSEGPRKILRFMGGIDLTDYLGPICSLDDREDVAGTLVEWLIDTEVEWDEFDAHNMPVPLGFAEFLVERVDALGLRYRLDQEETSAVLPLPSNFESYLENLESKERRELRRKRRRLERDASDASFRTTTAETLEGDLKLFVDMHRGTEGHKGHFMRPAIATYFERVARALMPLGWLRLDFLEIGGRAVATTFGFELGGRFYLYNSAYDGDVARLSPGVNLVSKLVEEMIERGFHTFDFLRGPERYKYQLGGQAVPLNNLRVSNPRSV